MRKAIGFNAGVLVIAMVFISGTAFAGNTATGNAAPSGPHWNVNFIGHPKDYKGSGEDSSGHSIIIPLRNVQSRAALVCNVGGVNFVDDVYPPEATAAPTSGARIYFQGGDTFAILDRDATDGEARIQLPVDMNSTTKELKFQAYMRVLGKPNACMNINAYVQDALDSTTWYSTGTVTLFRDKGKQTFVRVTDLFAIWFCTEWDSTHTTCLNTENLSVFADQFSAYFWQILNDGTRLVQVRFYPTN